MGFTITVLVACSAVILRGEGEHLGQDFRTATWIFTVLGQDLEVRYIFACVWLMFLGNVQVNIPYMDAMSLCDSTHAVFA